jgi:hypothetical protein
MNKSSFAQHNKRKTPCVTPKIKCKVCTKQFKTKTALKQHGKRTIPCKPPVEEEMETECIVCEKDFKTKARLKQHMKKKIACKPSVPDILKHSSNTKTYNTYNNITNKPVNLQINTYGPTLGADDMKQVSDPKDSNVVYIGDHIKIDNNTGKVYLDSVLVPKTKLHENEYVHVIEVYKGEKDIKYNWIIPDFPERVSVNKCLQDIMEMLQCMQPENEQLDGHLDKGRRGSPGILKDAPILETTKNFH